MEVCGHARGAAGLAGLGKTVCLSGRLQLHPQTDSERDHYQAEVRMGGEERRGEGTVEEEEEVERKWRGRRRGEGRWKISEYRVCLFLQVIFTANECYYTGCPITQ